ncbi:MAG: IS1380 family transposase [Thermoanaerobaculia bacterium]
MKIPKRVRGVKFRSSGAATTSFAGLRFVVELASKLRVIERLRVVSVKKRRRGIPVEDFVMSLASSFLVGGDSLSDLSVLREETVTRELCFDLEVPAPTTAGERLRSFSLGHLRQLDGAQRETCREILERTSGSEALTLDVDSSIIEVYGDQKQGARFGYSGVRGLHPLLAFAHEERLLLGARLRAGNRASSDGVVPFLEDVLTAIPARRRVRLRMDAGFYGKSVEGFATERALGFSISARLTKRLRAEIEALPEGAWRSYPWEEEAEYAELRYRPTGWSSDYRLLVKRTPWFDQEQRLLDEHFFTPVITNLPGAASSLIRYHLARGGAENYIEEFKSGIGASHLPSRCFHANWAWLLIAALAYNLAQAFKLLLLPAAEQAQQIKKLRLHWLCVAARFIRTGRRFVLALARGPDTANAFERLQQQLTTL